MIVAFNPVLHSPIGQVIASTATSVAVVTPHDGIVEVADPDIGVYTLPDGITYAEWEQNHFEYRVLCAAGLQVGHPADYWRALATSGMPPVRLWATARMVEYTGRSTFWMSLRDQILKWLSTPTDQRQFSLPLSKRQWEAALNDPSHLSKGKQLSDDIAAGKDLTTLTNAMQGPLGDALVGSAEANEERVLDGA
ncbi:MAG: hypothetical protein EBT79_09780 [Actinobacteria bacterium]|nr:hypothetical protein [Actinomycetota bacterium]NBR67544.1 hypothetical protein [Actinomycetota bacterium]